MLVCPFGAPRQPKVYDIKTPYCARFSLVRGYLCVCPFRALTHPLRKKFFPQ